VLLLRLKNDNNVTFPEGIDPATWEPVENRPEADAAHSVVEDTASDPVQSPVRSPSRAAACSPTEEAGTKTKIVADPELGTVIRA
jgi:hypothetical protein